MESIKETVANFPDVMIGKLEIHSTSTIVPRLFCPEKWHHLAQGSLPSPSSLEPDMKLLRACRQRLHDCIPTLSDHGKKLDIRKPELPLIATHIPYHALPKSVLEFDCKIVYICREPKDTFVWLYHFLAKQAPNKDDLISLEEAFHLFCQGKSFYGPYLDHVLGFWKASKENPGQGFLTQIRVYDERDRIICEELG
ncbi:hypothetical protein V6N13_009038 [Hibiscus sabdariffa]|uniref:Sulfotransferase n=1 Tax=Hibiscus sabdariffa TaxID=183260 RepID=A0ABR2AES2_9ROSI